MIENIMILADLNEQKAVLLISMKHSIEKKCIDMNQVG
jgi:hypothetical protein